MRDPDEVPNKFYCRELASRNEVMLSTGVRENDPGMESEIIIARFGEPLFEFFRREISPRQYYAGSLSRLPTDPS